MNNLRTALKTLIVFLSLVTVLAIAEPDDADDNPYIPETDVSHIDRKSFNEGFEVGLDMAKQAFIDQCYASGRQVLQFYYKGTEWSFYCTKSVGF